MCDSGFLHTARSQTTGTVCDSGFLHTARSRTTGTVCDSGFLHTVRPRTTGTVCDSGFAHTVRPQTTGTVCDSGFLHTVRPQTTGTVCDSDFLHTVRPQTTQSSPCTTHHITILNVPLRHPELDSGSGVHKPRFRIKSGMTGEIMSTTPYTSSCTTHPVIVRFFVMTTVRMPFVTD